MKSRKFVSLFLSITYIFSSLIFVQPIAKADAKPELDDKTVALIAGIGIMDKGLGSDELISRNEFGAVLLNVFNKSNLNSSTIQSKKNSWESDYLLNSLEYDLNDSDSYVNYEEVMLSMINGLGYGYLAESRGGYPYGYNFVAADIGLLKGVSVQFGEAMRRETVARIIKNAFSIPFMSYKEGVGQNEGRWYIDNDVTIKGSMSLVEARGKVVYDGFTSIDGAYAAIREDVIRIAPIEGGSAAEFMKGTSGAEGYLGLDITYYYKDPSVTYEIQPTVIYAEVMDNYDEVTVKTDDVISFDANNNILKYNENEARSLKITLSKNANVVYNGRWMGFGSGSMFAQTVNDTLERNSGNMRFIRSNGSADYNLVFIEDYLTYRVESINALVEKEAFIRTKEGITIKAENIKNSVYTAIYKNGEIITLNSIRKDDVFFVAEAKPEDNIVCVRKIIVGSEGSVSGEVSEVSSDYVVISNKEYKLSEALKNSTKYDELKSGNSVTLYLDPNGRVFTFDNLINGNLIYGFLVTIGQSGQGTLYPPQAKLYTASNEMKIYDFADKITYNSYKGGRISSRDLLSATTANKAGFDPLYDNLGVVGQLVKYSLNSNGEITTLYTAFIETKENTETIDRSMFRRLDSLVPNNTNGMFPWYIASSAYGNSNIIAYRNNVKAFFNNRSNEKVGTYAFLAPDAKVFVFPYNRSITQDNLFACKDGSQHFTGNRNGDAAFLRRLLAYDMDENYQIHAFTKGDGATDSYKSNLTDRLLNGVLVVKSVKKVINKNGDEVERIVGINRLGNEETVTGFAYDSLHFDINTGGVTVGNNGEIVAKEPAKVGDVITFTKNKDDLVTNITLAFRPVDKNGLYGRPYLLANSSTIKYVPFRMAFGQDYYTFGASNASAYSAFPISGDNNNNPNSDDPSIFYGKVGKIIGGVMIIDFPEAPTNSPTNAPTSMAMSVNNPVVLIYNVQRETVGNASLGDVLYDDEVWMRCVYGNINLIVVIRR